jgi:hypothetical protein
MMSRFGGRRRRGTRKAKKQQTRLVLRNRGPQPDGGGNIRVPRSMPMPTTMTVDLTYDDPTIARNNAGSLTVGWRYRMNSAFDPDPLLASGAIPGFNEYATMYTAYRVTHFQWNIQLSNREVFPLVSYSLPVNSDLGANPAGGITLAGNTKGRSNILGAISGTSNTTYRGRVNISNFFGIAGYNYDDDYNAGTNANPSVVLYFSVGANAPVVLVSGMLVKARLTYTIVFNRRITLLV